MKTNDNIIEYPGVNTHEYNSRRLYQYTDSMEKQERWREFDILLAICELYEHDLIDIKWEPSTGEPIVIRKDGQEIIIKK